MEKKERNNEIKVGDLVRLKDDDTASVGVGLVLEEREDCSEIVDLIGDLRTDLGDSNAEIVEEIPEFLLFKPIYLVLWQGENISPTDKPVWMFKTELESVNTGG